MAVQKQTRKISKENSMNKIVVKSILMTYTLTFISFGLFGCATRAPSTAKIPKGKVKKLVEEKQVTTRKPVEKPRPFNTALPALPVIEGQVKPKRVPSVEFFESNYEKVYFEFDKFKLLSNARKTIRSNAELIRKNLDKHSNYKILIEGHCDERGSSEYNLALGERRAQRTRDYLVSLGISPNILYTKSWGEEKAIDTGNNEETWRKNRRAEFHIYQGK
jgi:peptidoglycan-associated lipoprotein